MTETPEPLPIEFRARRLKPVLSTLGCLAALWMLWRYYNDHVSGEIMKDMCLVVFLIILLGIAAFAINASRPRLICALTEEGLRIGPRPPIPWRDIAGVKVFPYRMPFVGILLKDPEAFLAPLSSVAQQAARMTLQRIGTPVVIQPEAAGISAEYLAEVIEEVRKERAG